MEVKFKKINDLAKVPTRGSAYAAGYDLYAATEYDIAIEPHKTVLIDTGISVALPDNTFGGIFARSGLAAKRSLRPANCVGVIDSDYRGPVMVALHNDSEDTQIIAPGERIAQFILLPFIPIDFTEVKELDDTVRGEGGFGSTGV